MTKLYQLSSTALQVKSGASKVFKASNFSFNVSHNLIDNNTEIFWTMSIFNFSGTNKNIAFRIFGFDRSFLFGRVPISTKFDISTFTNTVRSFITGPTKNILSGTQDFIVAEVGALTPITVSTAKLSDAFFPSIEQIKFDANDFKIAGGYLIEVIDDGLVVGQVAVKNNNEFAVIEIDGIPENDSRLNNQKGDVIFNMASVEDKGMLDSKISTPVSEAKEKPSIITGITGGITNISKSLLIGGAIGAGVLVFFLFRRR